jgi:hypothetical protein
MKICSILVAASLAVALSACSTVKNLARNGSYGVAAANLDSSLVKNAQGAGTSKAPLYILIANSEDNCNAFVNGLISAETGTNTSLDVTTTALNALATAFTPLGTVHSLTAAAAITGGWKTAIDSDIFSKATAANFAQAIQSTYYKSLQTEVASLRAAQTSDVDGAAEVTVIKSIHAQCALGPAESSITAALTPSQNGAAGVNTTTTTSVTLGGTIKPGDTVTLVATWSNGAGSPSYKATTNQLSDAVAGLINKIKTDPILGPAGVTAAASPTANTLLLQTPTALGITWNKNIPADESITMNLAPVPPPAAAPAAVVAPPPVAANAAAPAAGGAIQIPGSKP